MFKYFAKIQIFKTFSWNDFKLNGINGTKRIVRQQQFTTILFCICIMCVCASASVFSRLSFFSVHFYFFQNPLLLSFCYCCWCSTSCGSSLFCWLNLIHTKSNLTLLIRVRFDGLYYLCHSLFGIQHSAFTISIRWRHNSKKGREYKRVLPSSVIQWQHIYVSICFFVLFQLNFRLLLQFWLRFNNLV